MKQSIAVWHYPYRTPAENVRWFAAHGFSVISQEGLFFFDTVRNADTRSAWNAAVRDTGIELTLHSLLPSGSSTYKEDRFREDMALARSWYDEMGALKVISFDVPLSCRPNASHLMEIVLKEFEGTPVLAAMEDYGLTEEERSDEDRLLSHPNYAALVDIGHMNIRLCAKQTTGNVQLDSHGEGAPLPPGDNSPAAFKNALSRFRPRIAEFHLHNNDGASDQHNLLDDGNIDMRGMASVLESIAPDAICTLEFVPGWTDGPYLQRNLAAQQECWDVILSEFRLCKYSGTEDPARDERLMASVHRWREYVSKAK